MKVNQFDPSFDEDEIAMVCETIRGNWVTEGPKTRLFEAMLRERTGARHVVLVPNGTLALFVALKNLGIGPGDEVIVPAFTFVASATSVVLAGATPVFADVDEDDFNVSLESARECLSARTRAIMPVHVYGQAARMDEIAALARERGLLVVEDAAQGLGVTFGERHVGTIGDAGCVSFYADKTITTAEGGAILTDDDRTAERCLYFKNQGRLERGSFVHPRLGYNFRITDLQAALGVAQMRKLPRIIERKRENERLYRELLADVEEVRFPRPTDRGSRVPFRVNVLVPDPEEIARRLEEKGVGVRRFFYPLDLQPCFDGSNARSPRPCETARRVFERGLSLPSGAGLGEDEIRTVCEAIRDAVRRR